MAEVRVRWKGYVEEALWLDRLRVRYTGRLVLRRAEQCQ